MFNWVEEKYSIKIRYNTLDIVLGICNENNDDFFDALNFVFLFAKHYIYKCKVEKKDISFDIFRTKLYLRLDVEKYIAITENSLNIFKRRWSFM